MTNITKGDKYTIKIFKKILREGVLDKWPRPHYEDFYPDSTYDEKTKTITTPNGEVKLQDNQTVKTDGDTLCVWTPAHTLSVNTGVECTYNLAKGESPLVTLRPIAVKNAIAELFWIYQKQSNDLVVFDELLGKNTWDQNGEINNWWKDWAIRDENGEYVLNEAGHPTIGTCYGETVRRHNLVNKRLEEMKNNPDGRRHIISMWQEEDFNEPHGLKPCAFMTIWNIRHGKDGKDYLDMTLVQRSSDFATAGCINQVQYSVLVQLFARHLGLTPGYFTWKPINVQIYDRHVEQVKEMLNREPIPCSPRFEIISDETDFFKLNPEDVKLVGYPREEIKEKNKQLTFPLGI